MFIPTHDLVDLISATGARANAVNAEQVRFTLRSLTQSGIVADSDSEASQRVRKILDAHTEILTDDARNALASIHLIGLETNLCDAVPRVHRDSPCILIHEGLLQLLRYYTDLQQVITLLRRYDERIDVGGEPTTLALAASLAGHATLVASIESGHQLIDISAILGPTARQRSGHGYGAAALFIVLHELGHHRLGHLDAGYVSERVALDTMVAESWTAIKQMEIDADRFALSSIKQSIRAPIISSVMLAFGPFSFLESFSGARDAGHPLTVNRLAALASTVRFPDEPEMQAAMVSIIDSETGRFQRLADQRKAVGNISGRIREHMPLELAYDVLDRVGRWVRKGPGLIDFD